MSAGDRVAPIGRTIRFGVFEVDFAAAELRKRGKRVKLEAQPFHLLCALLRRPGELVTREDLQHELWPADTFVEFDHSVNTAVKKIRQALDDSPRNPTYIETVPRQGYRFVAAVESEPSDPSGSRKPPRLGRPILLVTLILLVGIIFWGWLSLRDPSIAEMISSPLTSYPGEEGFASFSPTGNEVAFQWNGGEAGRNFDIYIKQLGVERPFRLTDHPAPDVAPAWSPDGKWIAFARYLSAGRAAYIIKPQRGGREHTLVESDLPELLAPRWPRAKSAWTPDSKWLVVTGKRSPEDGYGLFLVSVETQQLQKLTEPPDHRTIDYDPSVSPDGSKLVFCRSGDTERYQLHLLRLSVDLTPEGEPERLAFNNPWNQEPAWTPNSQEIVFTAGSHLNDRGLFRMATSKSAQPQPLVLNEAVAHSPVISADGRRLVYTASRLKRDIWRLEVPGQGIGTRQPRRFLDSTWFEGGQRYSPDGRKIAFVSQRSGSLQIWVCESNGTYLERLTSLAEGHTNRPKWSPSGEHIAFYSSAEGDYNIYVVSASGGAVERLTSHPANDINPGWSNNGNWVYFESDRSGTMEIWKVSADGGEPIPLGVEGGDPVESHDGIFLYFGKDGSVWRMPRDGGTATQVVDSMHPRTYWLIHKERIYFFSPTDEDGTCFIRYKDLHTDSTHTVVSVREPWWYIAVSPDRRTILYSQIDDAGSDLMLVENFQ